MPIAAASYPLVDIGSIGIDYAEVLARAYVAGVKPKDNKAPWTQFGDVDSANLALNVTWAKRYSKNRRIAVMTKNVATKLDSTFSMKVMSITDFVRLYALLGTPAPVVQALAAAQTFTIPAASGIFNVGSYNISNVTAKLDAVAFAGAQKVTIIDAAAGNVLVEGVDEDPEAEIEFTFDREAYSGTKTKIGTKLSGALEIIVRGVSDEGQKGILHLIQVPIGPKGDVPFISTSDTEFNGIELEGSPVLSTDDDGEVSLGEWIPLDA